MKVILPLMLILAGTALIISGWYVGTRYLFCVAASGENDYHIATHYSLITDSCLITVAGTDIKVA